MRLAKKAAKTKVVRENEMAQDAVELRGREDVSFEDDPTVAREDGGIGGEGRGKPLPYRPEEEGGAQEGVVEKPSDAGGVWAGRVFGAVHDWGV